MKNIFKSLMFVAVAAMTFTACEKDNAENNNNNGTEQKTTITFNAKMADTDTRTYFGAYDEENGYPTLLNGNEVAKFNSWTSRNGSVDPNKEVTINNGRFTVELMVNNGYIVDAYLPASAWGNANQNWNGDGSSCVVSRDYAFPMEQNPTTTSVDPAAHIFKATTTYNGEDNIDLYFEHQVAYGKMSLRNFAGADVEQYVLTINGEIYVVNATWTTDVWFACEPAEVSEMSVSVVTANGTYTKPLAVSAENTLNFVKGQVSAFGVNMDGVASEETEVIEFDGTIKSWKHTDTSYPTKYEISGNHFSFKVGMYNNRENYIDSRNGGYSLGDSSWYARYFSIHDFIDESISASTLTPTAGLLEVLEGGSAGALHNIRITLTINGVEYVYTYYGYINGEAVDNGGNEGGEEPEPVQLATPTVSASANGNTVTATWASVTGAANYTVSVNGTLKEAALNATSYAFVGEYETAYTISVVANPANATTHTASEAGTASVETGADPNAGGGEGGGDESVLVSCKYMGTDADGLLNKFQLKSASGNTVIEFMMHPDYAPVSMIAPGTYTSDSFAKTYNGSYKVCVFYNQNIKQTIDGEVCYASTSGSTFVVAKSGSNYTINVSLALQNGSTMQYTFDGPLS